MREIPSTTLRAGSSAPKRLRMTSGGGLGRPSGALVLDGFLADFLEGLLKFVGKLAEFFRRSFAD